MSGKPSAALVGLERGRVASGPETIHVDVTNACNTNCITCWDHSPLLTIGRDAAWKRRRLEAATLDAVLDDAIALGGLRAVILSGMGEPFTRPDIHQLIDAVKRRGLHLTIITNLVLADPERVLGSGVDQLLVGIHAATERSYLAFHPSFGEGSWERLRSLLVRYRDAGRRWKHVHVLCRKNATELVEMVRLGHELAAEQVNFKLASLRDGTEAARITPDQRELLLDRLLPEARSVARELGVVTNLEVLERQLMAGGSATAPIAEIGCFMGYAYARVTVDGTVLYCCNTQVVVGRLADARFAELWDGPRWNELRARLRRGEYFPSCAQCGKVAQNLALRARFARCFGEARARQVTGVDPETEAAE